MAKTYDPNVDYKKKMDEAAANGDMEQAAYYEEKRNEKIKGEGLSQYTLTHRYEAYLPKTTEKKMEEIFQKLQSRDPFSYDPTGDKLYETYRTQYEKAGSLAREDASARAAAMTGGYGNSYGQTVGQEAYEDIMSGLDSLAMELYDRAKEEYEQEGDALLHQYDRLAKELDREQKLAAEEYDRALAAEKLEYDRQQAAEKLEYDRQQAAEKQEYARNREQQEQALTLALSMLSQGLMPSQTVLERSGLATEDVEALYEANRWGAEGGSGSGASSGGSHSGGYGSGSGGSGSGGSGGSGSGGSGSGNGSGSTSSGGSGSKTSSTGSGGKTTSSGNAGEKELTNTLWEKLRTTYRSSLKEGDMSDFIQLRSMLVAQGYGVGAFDTWARQTYGKDYTTGAEKTIHWGSVLELGYGPIGIDQLNALVASGELEQYTQGDYIYFRKKSLIPKPYSY